MTTNNGTVLDEIMKSPWSIKNQNDCILSLGQAAYPSSAGIFCNATYDSILCWPAAPAGTTTRLQCPPLPGLDTSKFGYRTCGADGRWEEKFPGDRSNGGRGYTNYTDCYTPETYELYRKFFVDKTPAERQIMRDIISSTRTMDVVGLWLSLVTSLLSLFIFSYFRTLRCHRTRIHRNLFVSIIVQITIRLTVYVDQFVARMQGGEIGGTPSGMSGAIYDTPVFCEILYTLLEYSKTVQFMWMLIEGLYLHNMIAVSVFSKKPNYVIFYAIGWGGPIPVTIAWSVTMAVKYKIKCWYPYYYLPYIWIIEAPRFAVIAINLLFLLNIIRVLVLKLSDSHTNEAQVVKVRKAIKAALFLLPLLGITNFVVMIEGPTDHIKFAIWSYTSHFLVSFQGLIISVLYCFLNGEVQETLRRQFCLSSPVYSENSRTSIRVYPPPRIDKFLSEVQLAFKKRWERYRQSRMAHSSSFRRLSRSFSVFTSFTEVPHQARIASPPGAASSSSTTKTLPSNGHAVPLLREILARQESGL